MDRSISVILNVYKRPYTLEKQIEAIKNQSVYIRSEDIHIWYNTPNNSIEQMLPEDEKIKTYECNYNTKFFGRFTIPLLCKTKYIAIFDDDIIPGHKWLENCINNIEKMDGIIGGSGVITDGKGYINNYKIGWNGEHHNEPKLVDLVGHAWFFKQEYAKFMWLETPPSWDNGEDMFLSYIAQKHGIPTYVPPHPIDKTELWSNNPSKANTKGIEWGSDSNGHSMSVSTHYTDRDNLVKKLKNMGWKLLIN